MKDAHAAFEELLQDVINLAGKGNARGCFVTATSITRLSALLGFNRGIFVAEVLEGVFSQAGPVLDRYPVPGSARERLFGSIIENLHALLSDYKGDKARLYDILEDLAATATKFQLECASTAFAKDGAVPDGRPERGAEYAESGLWTRHGAVKRKNAALEAELETRKKRESLLLKLLKHERENRRPPGRKPGKADPADLERVQAAFANLSMEDVVRAVRSARDAG